MFTCFKFRNDLWPFLTAVTPVRGHRIRSNHIGATPQASQVDARARPVRSETQRSPTIWPHFHSLSDIPYHIIVPYLSFHFATVTFFLNILFSNLLLLETCAIPILRGLSPVPIRLSTIQTDHLIIDIPTEFKPIDENH